MISKEIYSFLNDLANNNNKDWFSDNRKTYEECKTNFAHIVEFLIHEISSFDSSIAGIQPKDCIFRINRDIRFAKNKSPYKTNFGAFIAPGGRNSGKAGYYLHVEPGQSFIAGGIYMPPSPTLKSIRQEIYDNYEEFLQIVTHQDFIKYFGGVTGEKLKTKPKGFPEEFEGIEYLKFKHYNAIDSKTDEEFMDKDFFLQAIKEFEAMSAFNKYLNNAIAN